jgi:hypothetical protein
MSRTQRTSIDSSYQSISQKYGFRKASQFQFQNRDKISNRKSFAISGQISSKNSSFLGEFNDSHLTLQIAKQIMNDMVREVEDFQISIFKNLAKFLEKTGEKQIEIENLPIYGFVSQRLCTEFKNIKNSLEKFSKEFFNSLLNLKTKAKNHSLATVQTIDRDWSNQLKKIISERYGQQQVRSGKENEFMGNIDFQLVKKSSQKMINSGKKVDTYQSIKMVSRSIPFKDDSYQTDSKFSESYPHPTSRSVSRISENYTSEEYSNLQNLAIMSDYFKIEYSKLSSKNGKKSL